VEASGTLRSQFGPRDPAWVGLGCPGVTATGGRTVETGQWRVGLGSPTDITLPKLGVSTRCR
jgi:hypothetical protein